MPLKYETTAEIGDRIQAWDFEPRPGRPEYPDRYFIGQVVDKGMTPHGYYAYTVLVEVDTRKFRIGQLAFVPFELSIHDWEGRVVNLRMPWANANRIADDHAAEVSRLDAEAAAAVGLDAPDEDEPDPGQRGPCPGHKWNYTGTAYGGDDPSYHGEGRVVCEHCGADGDA